jgi:hypothetical protein
VAGACADRCSVLKQLRGGCCCCCCCCCTLLDALLPRLLLLLLLLRLLLSVPLSLALGSIWVLVHATTSLEVTPCQRD